MPAIRRKRVAKKTTRVVKKKGKARTVPCETHPEWSSARYRTFVRSALRLAWTKWPPKYEALRRVRRASQSTNKKLKWEYLCAHCNAWTRGDKVSVDHIIPWGDPWAMSFVDAVRALLVPIEELQVLCDPCHDVKTISDKRIEPTP